jgi:hypothetical protein
MTTHELKTSRTRKVIFLISASLFWVGYIYICFREGAIALYAAPLPFVLTGLLWSELQDVLITISGETIIVKKGMRTKKISTKDLLNFQFRHSVDSESGTSWGFMFNTTSTDFNFGAPIPLPDCLPVAEALLNSFEPHCTKSWTGIVTTKNDILSYEKDRLLINDVEVAIVDYQSGGNSLDPVILSDKNGNAYRLDLSPIMRDYYLFKEFYKKKIHINFSFAKTY